MNGILPQQSGLSAVETQAAVNDGLNIYQAYQNPFVGTIADMVMRGGKLINNYKSFGASGGAETLNLFEFSGNIKVHALYAIAQSIALGNHTGAYFNAYGSAKLDLTESAVGADLSSMSQGAMFYKSGLATSAIDFTDNPSAAPILNEKDPTSQISPFQEFDLRSEVGQTNYIRYTYSSTDTPTTGDAYFYIVYTPLDDLSWVTQAF